MTAVWLFRAVFIQHAALGLREIGIAARQRQTARFVVGRNDEQRPRMRIDVLHGHAHRPVEIAHLRENSLRVVMVRHVVDHRPLDHEHEAFVPLRSVVRQNLQRLPDGAGKIVAAPLVCIRHVLDANSPTTLPDVIVSAAARVSITRYPFVRNRSTSVVPSARRAVK